MRKSDPLFLSATHAKRLNQLAAALAAFRRANPRRRFPRGLRAQVVAALDAGVSASAIQSSCGLSLTQMARWRFATPRGPASAPVSAASASVLSVVDADARQQSVAPDAGVEIRVGPWRVSLSRAVD